jgi:hypothetical protein
MSVRFKEDDNTKQMLTNKVLDEGIFVRERKHFSQLYVEEVTEGGGLCI